MIERVKISGGKWREQIEAVGIQYLTTAEQIKSAMKKYNLLATSRCSKTKTRKTGIPKEFYVSQANQQFYKWCEIHKLPYGIFSGLYGLHMFDEVKEFYDIHPSALSELQFRKLAVLIKQKMKERGYDGFLYFNSSPIMSSPYFYMMQLTKLKMFYISKLIPLNPPKGIFDRWTKSQLSTTQR